MSNIPLFDNKDLYETLMFSIGPLCTLIASRFGLKVWLRYEFVGSLIVAAMLILSPQQLLQNQIKVPMDNSHLFLCALYGCYIIYAALFQLFVSNKDESVFFGHFWAKIIAATLIVIENVFAYNANTVWNYKLLCFSTGNMIFDILVNTYFLIKTKKPKSQNQFPDTVNHIAKIEAFMLLSAGLILYAFPDQALFFVRGRNDLHRSLARVSGAILFSMNFESFCLSEFLHLDDKKQFMLGRLVGSLVELLVIVLGIYHYQVLNNQAILVFLFINMSYNLLVIVGYLITPRSRNLTPAAPKSD